MIAVVYVVVGSTRLAGINELWTDLKLAVLSLGQIIPDPIHKRSEGRGRSVPWGVAFALGTIIAYYFDHMGQWAGF